MTAILYNLDAMNLFAGDDDPNASLLAVISKVKIPDMTEKTKSHSGGGVVTDLEIGTNSYEPLSLTFSCEGINTEVTKGLGARKKYTMRGNIRNIQTGENKALKVIVEGKLTKYSQGEFSRDSGTSADYEVKEIISYQVWVDGTEEIYFDYFGGPLGIRIKGVQVQLQIAQNLGIA